MDKRNQLSIVIFSLIIIGGSITIPLTVRDHSIILDDFLNSPLFPAFKDEGIIQLKYSSDFTEQNNTLPLTVDYGILASNDSFNIQRIWINITEIKFLKKRVGKSSFFTNEDYFDILDALNETQILKSGNLTAATYSGIQIYFDQTVLIQTEEDIYIFEFQNKDFITLPFKMSGYESGNVDLYITENSITNVLLDFNFDVLWNNNTVRMTTKAFLFSGLA